MTETEGGVGSDGASTVKRKRVSEIYSCKATVYFPYLTERPVYAVVMQAIWVAPRADPRPFFGARVFYFMRLKIKEGGFKGYEVEKDYSARTGDPSALV